MKTSISTMLNEEMHLSLQAKLITFRAHQLNIYEEFETIPHHIVGVYPHLLKPDTRIIEI